MNKSWTRLRALVEIPQAKFCASGMLVVKFIRRRALAAGVPHALRHLTPSGSFPLLRCGRSIISSEQFPWRDIRTFSALFEGERYFTGDSTGRLLLPIILMLKVRVEVESVAVTFQPIETSEAQDLEHRTTTTVALRLRPRDAAAAALLPGRQFVLRIRPYAASSAASVASAWVAGAAICSRNRRVSSVTHGLVYIRPKRSPSTHPRAPPDQDDAGFAGDCHDLHGTSTRMSPGPATGTPRDFRWVAILPASDTRLATSSSGFRAIRCDENVAVA